ncbi:MAG: hypothetical protein KGL39_09510 [Patescibacteria group bacterium]|nr:hypothetical protein [Patescibacteria group bacterium]
MSPEVSNVNSALSSLRTALSAVPAAEAKVIRNRVAMEFGAIDAEAHALMAKWGVWIGLGLGLAVGVLAARFL